MKKRKTIGAITLLLLAAGLVGCAFKVREEFTGPSYLDQAEAVSYNGALISAVQEDSSSKGFTYGRDPVDGVAKDENYLYVRCPEDGCIYALDDKGKKAFMVTETPGDNINVYEDALIFSLAAVTEEKMPGIYKVQFDGTIQMLADCIPSYMQVVNEWLYYKDISDGCLYKMNLENKDLFALSAEQTGAFIVLDNSIYCTKYMETDEKGIAWYTFEEMDVNGEEKRKSPLLFSFTDFLYDGTDFIATDYSYGEIIRVDKAELQAEVLTKGLKISLPAKTAGSRIYFIDESKERTLAYYDMRTGEVFRTSLQDVIDFEVWGNFLQISYLQNGNPYVTYNNSSSLRKIVLFK